jgi:hypothetical protein
VSRVATGRPRRTDPVPPAAPRGPDRRPRAGRSHRPRLGRVVAFLLATVWLVIVLGPLYYMVLASLRSQGSYLTGNPWLRWPRSCCPCCRWWPSSS